MAEYAFITLLLNDEYLPGAQVLAHSLRDLQTQNAIAILVTEDVSSQALTSLDGLYDKVIKVETILSPALSNLDLLGRPDLKATLTKLNVWKQVQYKKVVFLDADTLVLQNIDQLFSLDVDFAAAPDIGWPDIFNSGVFLATPNMGTCAALMRLAAAGVTFDGGDQGLLNTYFSTFHRLSFTYNVTPSAGYQYQPAFKHFESQLKVAHFIGSQKPWTIGSGAQFPGAYGQLLARWWSVHDAHYDSAPSSSGSIGFSETWNATREAPSSAQSRPQAAGLSFASFKNTWDEPRNSAFHSPSGSRTPKSVHFERSKGPVENPVFPWEGKDVAQRSFPEDSQAPIQQIHTIPRNESSSPDRDIAQPDTILINNAWDSHADIAKYIQDAGISSGSDKPGPPRSIFGSGTHTPGEPELPEGQASGAASSSKGEFKISEASGIPSAHEWDPSSAVDKLASHAQTLAGKAAEQAKQAAQTVLETPKQ